MIDGVLFSVREAKPAGKKIERQFGSIHSSSRQAHSQIRETDIDKRSYVPYIYANAMGV
jgi:hypothetical protein